MTSPQWRAHDPEHGPQRVRAVRAVRVTPQPLAAPQGPAVGSLSVASAIRQAHEPRPYKTYREIALPNRFLPPRVAKRSTNAGALAEYLKRNERYGESNLYRYSVPARTIGNVVITAPNLAKGGAREVLRLTHGYDYPESARTSAWSSSDARGEPAAVKREIVHAFDIEGRDDLVPERRLVALENIQSANRLYNALAAQSPDTYPAVRPVRMAAHVRGGPMACVRM